MASPNAVSYPLVLTIDEVRTFRYMLRLSHLHRVKTACDAFTSGTKIRLEAMGIHGEIQGMPTADLIQEKFTQAIVALDSLYLILELPLLLEIAKNRGATAHIISLTQFQLDKVEEIAEIKYVSSDTDTKEDREIHAYIEQFQGGIQRAVETAREVATGDMLANHPTAPGYS